MRSIYYQVRHIVENHRKTFVQLSLRINVNCFSGFGSHILDVKTLSPFEEIANDSVIQLTARFRDIYKLCLTRLHEVDELDGLFQQFSFLHSILTGAFIHNDHMSLNFDDYSSDITKLLHHDAQMQVHKMLQNYIACMVNDYRNHKITDRIKLYDHMAEEKWRMMLWSSIDDLSKSSHTSIRFMRQMK